MAERLEMSAHRHPVNGAWIVRAIVRGYYVERAYYDYTKREALRLFREEARRA